MKHPQPPLCSLLYFEDVTILLLGVLPHAMLPPATLTSWDNASAKSLNFSSCELDRFFLFLADLGIWILKAVMQKRSFLFAAIALGISQQ